MGLYEISILVSAWASRKREQSLAFLTNRRTCEARCDTARDRTTLLSSTSRSSIVISGEAIRSRIGLVDLVTRYIVRQKGKRVRPILVLLSADLCGGITGTELPRRDDGGDPAYGDAGP